MKLAFIQTTHHDSEIMNAAVRAGFLPIILELHECDAMQTEYQGYILGGQFSHKEFFVQRLKSENQLGKPILGLSEAAYCLAASGLVPGLERDQVGARVMNHENSSIDAYLCLSKTYQRNAFTRHLSNRQTWGILNTEAQKCFYIPPALLLEMQHNGQDVFHYADEARRITDSIAAISNKSGNILAMIPLPHSSIWDIIFSSMREYIETGYLKPATPLFYQPR